MELPNRMKIYTEEELTEYAHLEGENWVGVQLSKEHDVVSIHSISTSEDLAPEFEEEHVTRLVEAAINLLNNGSVVYLSYKEKTNVN